MSRKNQIKPLTGVLLLAILGIAIILIIKYGGENDTPKIKAQIIPSFGK